MSWTRFMDMHSGGGSKEKWQYIYIEAPEDEAKLVFYNRFGHSPERVSCTCCGDDYSISENETLEQATGYDRGCDHDGKKYVEQPSKWRDRVIPLAEYVECDDVLIIRAAEIKPEERHGRLPEQGYVWVD